MGATDVIGSVKVINDSINAHFYICFENKIFSFPVTDNVHCSYRFYCGRMNGVVVYV